MPSARYESLPDSESRSSLLSPPSKLIRRRPGHGRLPLVVVTVLLAVSFICLYRVRQTSYTPPRLDNFDILPPAIDDVPLKAPMPAHGHGRPGHHHHTPNLKPPLPPASGPQPPQNDTALVPVTFSLVMFSQDSAAEGAILIKSIIMYTSSPLSFHIICDLDAQLYLEHRLGLLTHPQYDIIVHYYRIPHEDMVARIHREGALHTDHSAGVPGLMKLFIHEILPPTVQRAIFVDTDAFFISDPTQLWAHFDSLDPGVAISMPSHPDQYEPNWHNANRICSCIMLLDLTRLRQLRLMDSKYYREDPQAPRRPPVAPPAFEAMYGKPVPDPDTGRTKYDNVKLGDQGYWWAIVSHRPELFQHLSFDWEISSCLMDMYNTGLGKDGDDDVDEDTEARSQVHTKNTPEQGRAVLPKMLHFNCLDGVDRYYDWPGWDDPNNRLAQRWLPAVRYHVGFKWIWLNQPASNSTLTMETVHGVKFADELFAETVT